MDEGIPALSGEDLPFLLVVTYIGVHTEGQERDNNVQIIIRTGVGEDLCEQTVCKEKPGHITQCLDPSSCSHNSFHVHRDYASFISLSAFQATP